MMLHHVALSDDPSRRQSTRADRKCRCSRSAAARRPVIGTYRSRPPFGTVTWPFHSDRCTHSCRLANPRHAIPAPSFRRSGARRRRAVLPSVPLSAVDRVYMTDTDSQVTT